ncbi:uncharacterized protein F4822DRAFT_423254 [Hypoxylon trugodes]|uniref:uncharacterized protein n=1 Tax=Hypoxylon trugodes TaxID=326681 RepID=UPI00219C6C94|nr:uncharacterized protein F4822DRAFT_423254 [Hypoxylon trugodes]KAI1382694.1 hypothetical protein F4822DRAFT_423254 [Hypoxylon trugodes]
MYALITAALTLVGAAVAAPAALQEQPAHFRLHATGELAGWAIVNSHTAAGTNTIQIQRPTAYVSDIAYVNGTNLYFDLPGAPTPYGVAMPGLTKGTVGQVFSKPGEMSVGFAVNPSLLLTYNSNTQGFYACSINGVYELFYGLNPEAANLPGKCVQTELQVSAP